MNFVYLCTVCVLTCLSEYIVYGQIVDTDHVQLIYSSKLLESVGNGSLINAQHVKQYFSEHNIEWIESDNLTSCLQQAANGTLEFDDECLVNSCLSPSDVYSLSGLSSNVTQKELSTLSAILLHLSDSKCHKAVGGELTDHHSKRPSAAEAWGYGILCVSIINLCALAGMVALPFVHGGVYKKMLICMVGLAVGTLCGSSLLFLIPEALGLGGQELNAESSIWKCMTVLLGIYSFFIIERVLKMIMTARKIGTYIHEADHYCKMDRSKTDDAAIDFSSFHQAPPTPNAEYKDVEHLPHVLPCGGGSSDKETSSGSSSDSIQDRGKGNGNIFTFETKQNSVATNGTSTAHTHKPIASVAWMVIFGDAIHNFIDGVSIGAAFTESVLAGVSVCVATFCEELPHELGDFAVLLNAGMPVKKAVLYNFLSAATCYLGLIVGIFLGENTGTHSWVFAFAGGMFLYISLVDMMPEMNNACESEENLKTIGAKTIFLLQNLGLLTGIGIMVLMSIYGGNIAF